MKIRTITYKKIKNLGNYETESLEVTGEVEDGDDPDAAVIMLKEWVKRKLYPIEPENNESRFPLEASHAENF